MDTNLARKNKKIGDEFDIVMYNGKSLAIIEIKYKAHVKDVERITAQKLPNFRALFPQYAEYPVYLGIGILQQKGGVMEADTSHIRAY
jgi:hypothetical protein